VDRLDRLADGGVCGACMLSALAADAAAAGRPILRTQRQHGCTAICPRLTVAVPWLPNDSDLVYPLVGLLHRNHMFMIRHVHDPPKMPGKPRTLSQKGCNVGIDARRWKSGLWPQ
jgi:hypothetical protein